MNKLDSCKICGEGNLQCFTESRKTKEGYTVEYNYSICDSCESELCTSQQLRKNKRNMLDAKRVASGLLSGQEIRNLREKLGISQLEASKIFGGGVVAFSKYENGDIAQSAAMDKLLRIAANHEHIFYELMLSAGLEIKTQSAIWQLIDHEYNQFYLNSTFNLFIENHFEKTKILENPPHLHSDFPCYESFSEAKQAS